MNPDRVARLERLALAATALVRVGGLLAIGRTAWVDQPLVDAYTYWEQATQILAGKDPFPDGYYQAPGYPWFLVGVAKLTGGLDFQTVRAVQLGLGLLTVWLIMRLGRALGEARGAPWLGAAAGAIYGLYPTALLFELDLLTPALTNVLLAGALALVWVPGGPAGPRGLARAAGAGALLGLAAAVHPTFALGLLGLAVGLLPCWRLAGAALLGGALIIGPVSAQNASRSGSWAMISHNSGLNFYLGNSANWQETSFLRPGLPFRELVLEAQPDQRGRAELDDWWWERARGEIGADPVRWANSLIVKAAWSVNRTEIPRNEDYRCRTEAGPLAFIALLPARYAWVFPLGVVGLVALARRRDEPGPRALVFLWAGLHLPLVLFLVADRYRVASWPVLALAAPVGALALTELARARRWPALAAVGVAAVLPWLPIDPITQKSDAWCRHVEGNLAYGDKDYALAEQRYAAAVALDAQDLDAWRWLAYARHEQGRDAEAIEPINRVLADFPDHYPTLMFKSQLLERLGDLSGAADAAGLAYRVPGERTNTGARYVKLLVRAGRMSEARAVVEADPKLQRSRSVRAALSGESAPPEPDDAPAADGP